MENIKEPSISIGVVLSLVVIISLFVFGVCEIVSYDSNWVDDCVSGKHSDLEARDILGLRCVDDMRSNPYAGFYPIIISLIFLLLLMFWVKLTNEELN